MRYYNRRSGNDTIDGNAGNNFINGGRGDDMVDGGAGNDWVFGGSGNDTVTGGAGSDVVYAGWGNDEAIYNLARNDGAHDYYSGGFGHDTLTLVFTAAEWSRADIKTDVDNYLEFLNTQANSYFWWCGFGSFSFDTLGLRARSFEELKVIVDGVEIDPTATNTDPTVVAALTASLAEDGGPTTIDLLDGANDTEGDTLSVTNLSALPDGVTLTGTALTVDPSDAAFQDLGAGETRDITVSYTIDDGNGGSVNQTLTVTVTGTNDAPTYSGAVLANSAVGNGADGTLPVQDLAALFADKDGDTFVFTSSDLPAGLSLSSDGTLTQTAPFDTGDLSLVGDHTFTVTVDDGKGGTLVQELGYSIALNNAFGGNFGRGNGNAETVTGSAAADTANFGQFSGAYRGGLSVDLGEGDNTLSFGTAVGTENGFVDITLGDGDNTLNAGYGAGQEEGAFSVITGDGDNTFQFGHQAGAVRGEATVAMGSGGDSLVFASSAASAGGSLIADTGAGNDVITFGDRAGQTNGSVTLSAGLGADTITFGTDVARKAPVNNGAPEGQVTIDLGAADGDADTLVFQGTVFNAVIQNWEAGLDTVDITNTANWTGIDDGTNTAFSNGQQDILFAGITGLGTDVNDFFI